MHNPIKYGICYSLLRKDVEPGCHGQLADDNSRFSCMPVLDYFHDIILLLAVQRGQSKVIEDEQIRLCQFFVSKIGRQKDRSFRWSETVFCGSGTTPLQMLHFTIPINLHFPNRLHRDRLLSFMS